MKPLSPLQIAHIERTLAASEARLRSIFERCKPMFERGAVRPELEIELGKDKSALLYFLRKSMKYGWIFPYGKSQTTRYFLSAEAAAAWGVAWQVDRYERKKARVLARYHELRAHLVREPVPCLPKGERKPDSPAARFKRLEAFIPPHVTTQICPCGKDNRFTVPADYVGPFGSMRIGEYLDARAA